MTSETVSLIANVALTLSFIVGLVFGIAQVRAAARDRRERLTLDTLSNFQSREFAELIFYILRGKIPTNQEEMQALPANEQIMFIQFGQQMESLGLLVAEGLIDLDLVEKTLGSFVTGAWARYKVMFQDIREKQPDPFLGEYFQWLSERIEERMRKSPRKPVYQTAKPNC